MRKIWSLAVIVLALPACSLLKKIQPPIPPPPPGPQKFVLDWTGGSRSEARQLGTKPMNLSQFADSVPPADLSPISVWGERSEDPRAHYNPPIGKLSDFPNFKEDVRARVQSVLSKLRPANIMVVNGELKDHPGATIIWMTFSVYSEAAGTVLGHGTRDDGNRVSMDEAVIYLKALVSTFTVNDITVSPFEGAMHPSYSMLVMIVSNATAHEAAHTLGFRHSPTMGQIPNRDLMRGGHSNTSMDDDQRFYVEYHAILDQQPDMQYHESVRISGADRTPTNYTFIGPDAERMVILQMRNTNWPKEFSGKDFEFLIDPPAVSGASFPTDMSWKEILRELSERVKRRVDVQTCVAE